MGNLTAVERVVRGKVVLVTGAGGSIGSALTEALGRFRPKHTILLDHSERNLNEIITRLGPTLDGSPFSAVLGSVADRDQLLELFDRHRPDVVFHAAAFKHVPMMESNPLAAVQNNGMATYILAKVSREKSVSNLVMVSTDKAVNPISIMGASKRVAELALACVGNSKTRMSAIRLGNVLGTEGSVVPRFLDQISRRGPVTVTHPDATRYFLTLEEAVELILLVSAEETRGLFIPKLAEPVKILQMAMQLIENSRADNRAEIELTFTGLRPGDKLTEEFMYSNEKAQSTANPRLLRIVSSASDVDGFETGIENLSRNVRARDIPGTLETLRRLVPEYQPSDTVLRLSQELTA